jgi:peptidoglycan/xylan/chitin deacetylase (PgdA/CDA1 family)
MPLMLLGRRARQRLEAHALILMYHRVAELPTDPHLLAVRPERFADQLRVLNRDFNPLSLEALVASLEGGKVPQRGVVLTFDDGYTDNLTEALPLLERERIPASMYITAGFVGQEQEFWWDALERVLLLPGELPARLQLEVNGQILEWNLGTGARLTFAEFEQTRAWSMQRPDDPGERQRLYRSAYFWLYNLDGEDRQQALAALLEWAGLPQAARPTQRVLNPEQLSTLAASQRVDIGAHTMSHPLLAAMSVELQRREILSSKEKLEAWTGRPVRSFAYPHGSGTGETMAILRESGFSNALSSHPDAVWRGADVFNLPRLVARDLDGPAFSRWLESLFHG